MGEQFRVVIPARYRSQRLPGKPLADIAGMPMVVRVAERAALAGAAEVVVATDDERIRDAVAGAGQTAMMTRPEHVSGSDRVMEVAERGGWPEDAIVVNVQGDEPLIPPAVIRQVAGCLADHPDLPAATLSEPIHDRPSLLDPNVVKVVAGQDGMALYFSRAPVPHDRDGGNGFETGLWQRHVGIYGFRLRALRRFVGLPPGRLEQLERLEQLRLLENGIGLFVAAACEPVPGGVDTREDLQRVRDLLSP